MERKEPFSHSLRIKKKVNAQGPLAGGDPRDLNQSLDQVPSREADSRHGLRGEAAGDEQHELQRQESLRQQIALKEQQIAEMRNNTELLKQQLAQVARTGGSRPEERASQGRESPKAQPARPVVKHDSIQDLRAPFDSFLIMQDERQRAVQRSPPRGIHVYQSLRSRSGSRARAPPDLLPPRFGGYPRPGSEAQDVDESHPEKPRPQLARPDQQEPASRDSKYLRPRSEAQLSRDPKERGRPPIPDRADDSHRKSLKKPKPIEDINESEQPPAEQIEAHEVPDFREGSQERPEAPDLSLEGSHRPGEGGPASNGGSSLERASFSLGRPNGDRNDTLSAGRLTQPPNVASAERRSGEPRLLTHGQASFDRDLQDVNMFMIPESPPSRPPPFTMSQRDKLQVLLFENESQLRRLELVKREIQQVRSQTFAMKTNLDVITQRNMETQAIFTGEAETDVDKSITYMNKYIDHQRNANNRLQRQIDGQNNARKDVVDEVESIRSQNENSRGAIVVLGGEVAVKSEQITRLEAQNAELQVVIAESMLKLKDDEIEARRVQADIDKLEESIQSTLKEKEDVVLQLEEKANSHDKSMDAMTVEKRTAAADNTQMLKLIAAKVLFYEMERSRVRLLRQTFHEINQYWQFDKTCYTKLKLLTDLLYKRGRSAKQEAVKRWNLAALKPTQTKEHNEKVAEQILKLRRVAKPFHTLVLHAQQSRVRTHSRSSSLRLINSINKRTSKLDLKRSLQIWKEMSLAAHKQQVKIKRLLQALECQTKRQSLETWRNWSISLMSACRHELLKQEYANKLHAQHMTSSIKMFAVRERQNRYMIQAQVFKALQMHRDYRRFYLKANVKSLRLRREYRRYTLQACFHAMRTYSSRVRTQWTEEELNQNEQAIQDEHNEIVFRGQKILQKETKAALTVMSVMMDKNVFAYFQVWKRNSEAYKINMRTKFRTRIVTLYKQKLRTAFFRWSSGTSNSKIRRTEVAVVHVEDQLEKLKTAALEEERRFAASLSVFNSEQRKLMSKAVTRMLSRKAREGLYQWRRAIDGQQQKESAASMVIQRMRLRFVGHYFSIYKEFAKDKNRERLVEQRVEDFEYMQNRRILLTIYEKWCAYIHCFQKQKVYLRMVMSKLINAKLHRGFKQWVAGSQYKREWLLKLGQNSLTQDVETKHQVMGAFQNITDQQKAQITAIKDEARRKARKTLMNYYSRFYGDGSKRYFRTWKLVYHRYKTRQKYIIHMNQHKRKQMFDLVRSAFQAHAAKDRKSSREHKKKKLVIQCEEQEQLVEHNRTMARAKNESIRSQMDVSTRSKKGVIDTKKSRIDKTIGIMIDKNQKLEFKSKKRAVFYAWRSVAIDQRRFLNNITRVCQKSFMAEGFARIHDAYVKNKGQSLVYSIFQKWFRSFEKDHLRVGWSRWKLMAHKMAYDQEQLAHEKQQEARHVFEEKRLQIQEQNVHNIFLYFKKMRKIKIWRAWLASRKFNKTRQIYTAESGDKFAALKRKKYLQKWMLRIKETKRFRIKWQQFHENYRIRMKIKVFEVFQFKKSVNNTMAICMSNFERMMRTKMMDDAFKDVKSFYLSKKYATAVFTERATLDIESLLRQRHFKIYRRYFNRYKFAVTDEAQRKKRLKAIFGKFNAQRWHKGFRRWREYTENEVFVQEVNETGPITEHVFEATRLMRNLKEFMRSEGMPEELIKKTVQRACDLQSHRLKYGVLRWRLAGDPDSKLKIKVLDHWKMMIKLRMLMKYWLIVGNNRTQWVKADMQEAFHKWRLGDSKRAKAFDVKPLKYLQAHNLKQTNELLSLANREAKADYDLKDYSLQRDELLEHYIRGQRLALAACHERLLSGKKKAFATWASILKAARRAEGQLKVMEVVDQLTAIKDKKREIEKENQELAQENEELRRFSMDGYKIAESVNQLSAEREKLTIDLADQAETIKNLLEQNMKLQKQIEKVRGSKGGKMTKRPARKVTFDQVH